MKKYMRLRLKERDDLSSMFGEPKTLDELAAFVMNIFNYNCNGCKLIGFSWNIKCSYFSDSYNSPVYGVDLNVTTSTRYMGFSGRVWIKLKKYPDFRNGFTTINDVFNKTFTYTGSGGSGAYNGPFNGDFCYSFDYKFFIQDFPEIVKNVEEQQVINVLMGGRKTDIKHIFLWDDEKVRV